MKTELVLIFRQNGEWDVIELLGSQSPAYARPGELTDALVSW
jgi:hypothetical protein